MKIHKYFLNTFIMLWLASNMPAVASISTNYGNFEAATVWYSQVTESTDHGWYGSPTITGDTLNFSPMGIKAESSGGAPEMVNHAQLGFDVRAKAGHYIGAFNFSEGGDFSMGGLGTDATYVDVAANFVIQIYEVDGVAINTITENFSMHFAPNADGRFELITDGGTPSFFAPYQGVWNGSIYINLSDILTGNSVSYVNGATYANVYLDNILAAGSEPGTSALINAKFQNNLSITSEVIPEPSSLIL
ncbi:MAG TPA: hypothetical protein VLL07_02920, partial [Pontiella sp.]|nr:hypothetical protein [Pontiella sp.]